MKFFLILLCFLPTIVCADPRCPLADIPSPAVEPVNLEELITQLGQLQDDQGRTFLAGQTKELSSLAEVFRSGRRISKLEQFFQLLYWIQQKVAEGQLPLTVRPPGITEVLLTAKVFKTPEFPKKITATTLQQDDRLKPPLIRVEFSEPEVRFPINEGIGFASWDQGKCQHAKELVFSNGFSFRIRKARNSDNLVVDDFKNVDLFGDFGTRKVFKIDLKYVDLQKVEFIWGTDEGKVTAKVAKREFKENEHSKLFKFIGTLIPNTARQRIDW